MTQEYTWPQWSRIDISCLARYVTPLASRLLPLPANRFDLSNQPGQYRTLARAIYDELARQGIRYDLEEYHPSAMLQTIRTPAQVLRAPRVGTCLDLATLFCGLCLAYELLPIMVVLDGHALAAISLVAGIRDWNGYWRGRQLFERGPLTEAQHLRDLIDEGDCLALECTGFAHSETLGQLVGLPEAKGRDRGMLTFDQATEAGRRQLDQTDRPLLFAIDIAVAHFGWRIGPRTLDPGFGVPLGERLEGLSDLGDILFQLCPDHSSVERLLRRLPTAIPHLPKPDVRDTWNAILQEAGEMEVISIIDIISHEPDYADRPDLIQAARACLRQWRPNPATIVQLAESYQASLAVVDNTHRSWSDERDWISETIPLNQALHTLTTQLEEFKQWSPDGEDGDNLQMLEGIVAQSRSTLDSLRRQGTHPMRRGQLLEELQLLSEDLALELNDVA